jgi:hypothetical protein
VHESRVARTLRFEPGTIVVFDRGYNDYAWFAALDADGVYLVTRMKDNTDYGVLERRPVPERGPVQRDEIIFLYKLARSAERDLFLRRIEVWDQAQQRTLVFLTNHRDCSHARRIPHKELENRLLLRRCFFQPLFGCVRHAMYYPQSAGTNRIK